MHRAYQDRVISFPLARLQLLLASVRIKSGASAIVPVVGVTVVVSMVVAVVATIMAVVLLSVTFDVDVIDCSIVVSWTFL